MSGERTIHAEDKRPDVNVLSRMVCAENCRAPFLCEFNTELVMFPLNSELLAQVDALFTDAGKGNEIEAYAQHYLDHGYRCRIKSSAMAWGDGANVCYFAAIKEAAEMFLDEATKILARKYSPETAAATLQLAQALVAICRQFTCFGKHRAARRDVICADLK